MSTLHTDLTLLSEKALLPLLPLLLLLLTLMLLLNAKY